jgi:hypothetical protein
MPLTKRLISAGEHDLPAHRFDCVERVEEFFLRGLFTREEMHVVDHEQIELAHLPAEGVDAVVAQGGEEFIGEFFSGHVRPLFGGVVLDELLAQPLQQVGFAEAAIAVDEQWVVLRTREFGDV